MLSASNWFCSAFCFSGLSEFLMKFYGMTAVCKRLHRGTLCTVEPQALSVTPHGDLYGAFTGDILPYKQCF